MSITTAVSPAAVAQELTGRDYLSYSAISTYQSCPLRYYFRYVLGWLEPSVSSSLVFGAALHAALEHHYRALMQAHAPPSVSALLAAFRRGWQERDAEAEIRYAKSETVRSLEQLAGRMLTAFRASDLARPGGRIVGVEQQLCGSIVRDVPQLLARMDLLIETDEHLRVIDFKTARNSWSAEQADDNATQLLLYSDVARRLARGKPLVCEFIVLTKTRTPVVQQFAIPADEARRARARAIIRRVWRAIAARHFYPAPSPLACGSCPFREPCRQWTG